MNGETQLKEIYELQDRLTRGSVSYTEMKEILDGIAEMMGGLKREMTQNMAINKGAMETECRGILNKMDKVETECKTKLATLKEKQTVDIDKTREFIIEKVNEVKDLIPLEADFTPVWEKFAEFEKKIPKIPEPETPEEVVKKINLSKEQIDASKIRNLPQPVYETRVIGGGSGIKKIKAGTNILVTDTGNGEVTINSTATGGPGGAVDSVNGATGTVVLNQDDIGDGTTYKQYSATEKAKLSGVAENANNYSLPTASAATLGGVKVGARLTITDGVLSADPQSGTGAVDSVNTKTGAVVLTPDDLDDTATTHKFTSATDKSKLDGIEAGANNYTHPATHNADIITDGTTNKAYTAVEKTKLSGIAAGAEVNVNADWNAAAGDAQILNKPTLGNSSSKDVGTTVGTVAAGDHNHTGAYAPALGADDNYVTDAEKVKLANLSGTNTGDQDLSGLVPKTTTVNSKALSANITLTQDDVGDGTTNKAFTATEKTKLAGIEAGANNYTHPTTHSADILTDGTTNKAYTAAEKTKLAGIATGAEVNVNADWNAVSGDSQILNKPTIPVKATGAEVDTGTDDAKFVTAKAITDQTVLLKKSGGTMTGNLALGANSLTLTGSIASTGSRVTKGWFTDIDTSNMPTINGNQLVSDGVYGSDWNSVTQAAPSKNAVYDKIETLLPSAGGTITGEMSLDGLPNTDHTAVGPVTSTFAAGYSSAVSDLVFMGSGGKWLEVDADAVATCKGLLGIALEAKTDTQAMKVALPGSFVRDDTWNWTVGATLYAGETLGAMQETIPTGADAVVKVVGVAVSADVIWFMPSMDQQTVVA